MAITGSPSGGPFVISHGACDRSRVIGSSRRPAPLSLYPVRQSAAHPHRCGLGMVRTSRGSSARQDARGRGRGWWRLRDSKGHPGLSFLLIDVDRTGSAQSCPQLTLRQAQIRLPRLAADPPHLRLRPSLLPPCRVIPIATRSNPNDQPLRRYRPRQVHRYRWPGAHPFSARGCDVP
ncbi:hypothetical protein GFB49_20005 [Epibacterium sp. SM1979]|uniref:Uncharacterized protein n=1 Tax=Tritonibacter litoralis TaxID=2662264 RepID=A0A843YNJ9_9RHOB|nr:hypothetical protein [Tritonibacter litoralis]